MKKTLSLICSVLYPVAIYVIISDKPSALRNISFVIVIVMLSVLFLLSFFTRRRTKEEKKQGLIYNILLALGIIVFVLSTLTVFIPSLSTAILVSGIVVTAVFLGRVFYLNPEL